MAVQLNGCPSRMTRLICCALIAATVVAVSGCESESQRTSRHTTEAKRSQDTAVADLHRAERAEVFAESEARIARLCIPGVPLTRADERAINRQAQILANVYDGDETDRYDGVPIRKLMEDQATVLEGCLITAAAKVVGALNGT